MKNGERRPTAMSAFNASWHHLAAIMRALSALQNRHGMRLAGPLAIGTATVIIEVMEKSYAFRSTE